MVYPRASGKPAPQRTPNGRHLCSGSWKATRCARSRLADLVKTVIAKSSTLTFSKSFYRGGLISRRAALRTAYIQFVFLVGGADHDQMERMREYLSRLQSWNVAQSKELVAETLHDLIDPDLIYDEGSLAHRGPPRAEPRCRDRLTSARELVNRSARCWAPTGWSPPGWWSARTAASPARWSTARTARRRRRQIRQLAESEGYDLSRCYAYSDSATDLPMLEAVGHPYAVNPDRTLRRGRRGGTGRCIFDKPVRLKQRLPEFRMPPRPLSGRRGGRQCGRRHRRSLSGTPVAADRPRS